MKTLRDSFVIFKNWSEAINALPEEYQLETYKALVSYGLNGSIPEGLSPIANAMLISFSTGLENSIQRYNASVENGKKGGRPKKDNEKPENDSEKLKNEYEKLNKDSEKPENEEENLSESKEEAIDNSEKPINNSEKPIKNNEELNKNYEKPINDNKSPEKTQQNLEKPNTNLNDNVNVNVNDNDNDNENVNVNVNDNANDNANNYTSLSKINKNNYLDNVRACASEEEIEEIFNNHYKDYFYYWGFDQEDKACFKEVMQVLAEAAVKSKAGELRYYQMKIPIEQFCVLVDKLDVQDIRDITWQVLHNEDIRDRQRYILGALLGRARDKLVEE